jgi:hypothetical protein
VFGVQTRLESRLAEVRSCSRLLEEAIVERRGFSRLFHGVSGGQRLSSRLAIGALVVLALVGSIASFALAFTASFPDVPSSHPYHAAIIDLAGRGIIGGYDDGSFGPGKPVTRQQFAKMVVKTGGYPVTGSEVCPFTDVVDQTGADPFYPAKYVAVCAGHGITAGKGATTFDPTGKITRFQVVTMVVRMADDLRPGLLANPPSGWAGNSVWAGDAVHGANSARAEYNGLLTGLDLGIIDPYGVMSRGEVAQVLYNLLQLLSGVTPTTASTAAPASSTTTTASPVGKTPGNPVPKGQAAQVGDYSVKVTEVILNATQLIVAHWPDAPQAGSQYVLVTLSATNTGSTTTDGFFLLNIASYKAFFYGSKGDRFQLGGDGRMLLAMAGYPDYYVDMPPGVAVSRSVLFEVPSNQVSGGRLELQNAKWVSDGGSPHPTFEQKWFSTYFAVK